MTDRQIKRTTFILTVINTVLTPFVFKTMWNWFGTQIGLPHISYWLSFGIMLLIDFAIYIPSAINQLAYQDNREAIEFRLKNSINGTMMIVQTLSLGFLAHLAQ